ncbi:MAG: alpha-galactosidase [Pseudomonadota bacterium]
MIDDAPPFVTLRTTSVQLTLSAAIGQRPAILYWGDALNHASAAELHLLATRQWAFGGPTVDVPASLFNELGAGLDGPSGFLAHREGTDWATIFLVQHVEAPDEQTIIIQCHDAQHHIGIAYHFALDHETDVLSIFCTVSNRGTKPLSVDWMAATTFPLDQRLSRLRGFTGRWAHEFNSEEIQTHGGSYVRENKSGRTSHDSFPGLIALSEGTSENAGPCAGFHFGWSGNHRLRADLHTDGQCFVQMGELFFPGELELPPNASYTTPRVFVAWSSDGLNGLSKRFHHHVRQNILDQRTNGKPRPIHFNTWEAVYFDHSEEKLMALADQAASVGAERFVLDDGWFGGRRNDRTGLGDWVVAKDVYPQGLHRLVDHVRSLGMEFGIWFEPEMVNPDSDLYRAHPEWILSAKGVDHVPFRQQQTLDLTRPEVTSYLFEAINYIVDEYRVDYIKWDMNRTIAHPGDQTGKAATHRQTHAVYALMDRLRKQHPHLEIESCASGGARADYGVLSYTDRLWTSDNNDALVRQSIQRGASHFFPLQILGSHVGPKICHITGRVLDMSFRVGTALFGHMGIEADLSAETEQDLTILKDGIKLYKEYRALIHSGDFYRLDRIDAFNCVGVVAKDQTEALFSCTKLSDQRSSLPGRVRLTGLAARSFYRVRLIWPGASPSITTPSIVEAADLYGKGSILSGEALHQFGIQLPLVKPNTCLIFHLQVVTEH